MVRHTPPGRQSVVFALTALIALLVGCASQQLLPAEPSRIVFRNQGDAPCALEVDRAYFLSVAPRQAVLVGNLPAKPYELTASCGVERYRSRMEPEPGQFLEFVAPGEGAVDCTATLELTNPTHADLAVRLGDRLLGRLFAESTARFENLPVGEAVISLADIHTHGSWNQQVLLSSLNMTRLDVAVPFASLAFRNDSQESVSLEFLGRQIRLTAGEIAALDEIPPGSLRVSVRFTESGRTIAVSVDLAPGASETVKLSDASGNLVVENRLPEAVRIFLDDEQLAVVESGQERGIRGLAPGRTRFEARTDAGRVLAQQFTIGPDTTQAWILDSQDSQILLRNRVGERLQLRLDGRQVMAVETGAAVRFPVPPGEHAITALCEATGHTENRSVNVPGGRLVELTIGPLPGRLMIANNTRNTLRFFRNGRPLAILEPGQSVEHGGQPLGKSLIEVLDEKGKTILRKEVDIQGKEQHVARLDVDAVEIPVKLTNRTGEPVKLGPDVIAEVDILSPDEEVLAAVRGAGGVVKLKGMTTGNRYDRQLAARDEGVQHIIIDPVTGGIVVENLAERPLEVLLDGAPLARLEPGQKLQRERVPPGEHRLQARVDGKDFDQVSCLLLENSWYIWRLAEKTGRIKVLNRTPETLMVYLDGAPVGALSAGTETILKNLEPGSTTVGAIGRNSRQAHRFTCAVQPDTEHSWLVHSAAGGVRLVGFNGRSAELIVDGLPVSDVPAGAEEPVVLPLPPGPQVLQVRFDDGTLFGAVVQVTANLESTLDIGSYSPRITVRNQTGEPLDIVLDSIRIMELAAGTEAVVVAEHPGVHSLEAVARTGMHRWSLKDVDMRRGAAFGWTLTPQE